MNQIFKKYSRRHEMKIKIVNIVEIRSLFKHRKK